MKIHNLFGCSRKSRLWTDPEELSFQWIRSSVSKVALFLDTHETARRVGIVAPLISRFHIPSGLPIGLTDTRMTG